MILNDAPTNEVILSNVGEIGEFRIRNSAKAFSILSSGLYANKVRAIVRELSCNAVDSHTAAGKQATPFDVHLPNSLEPHFSIRDYGTGLTHEQVTQIYTTYFESTKTASNEFIGALGLGSKSPFSYTDNFTVTAVKDGKKGIYSAFINGNGVPSIALMMSEETTDPAGVEVKFSVNDRSDFNKFRDEARNVFTHFALRPVISGYADFAFHNIEYETKDIVPGIHSMKGRHYKSIAIMGNISYPIDVPDSDESLGELSNLLECGLEIHFGIGDLDFQASREGLSYIPQTMQSIKRKLETLNAQLSIHVAAEADKIANLWERTFFLNEKHANQLWRAAVHKYVIDTQFPLMVAGPRGTATKPFTFFVKDLASKFNITIRAFDRGRGTACVNLKTNYDYTGEIDAATGHKITGLTWIINISKDAHFITNAAKTGASERAKHHWRNKAINGYRETVYVLEAADKTKPAEFVKFFTEIHSPLLVLDASTLAQKPRETVERAKNVTILRMEQGPSQGWGHSRSGDPVWRDCGKLPSFDAKTVHYYIPLTAFHFDSKYGYEAKTLFSDLKECGIAEFADITLYGVRKGDIDEVKKLKNWVNLEDHIVARLATGNIGTMLMGMVKHALDGYEFFRYNSNAIGTTSPFKVLINKFANVTKVEYSENCLNRLCKRFAPTSTISPAVLIEQYVNECKAIYIRYPLLASLYGSVDKQAVAEYINLIDAMKGI